MIAQVIPLFGPRDANVKAKTSCYCPQPKLIELCPKAGKDCNCEVCQLAAHLRARCETHTVWQALGEFMRPALDQSTKTRARMPMVGQKP